MQKNILPLFWCLIIFSSSSIKPSGEEAKLSTVKSVSTEQNKLKKPLISSLYTDWCQWCKVMEKKTFRNQKVTDYLYANLSRKHVDFIVENIAWMSATFFHDYNYPINNPGYHKNKLLLENYGRENYLYEFLPDHKITISASQR